MDEGTTVLAYNRRFDAEAWPALSEYMTAHESAHLVWLGRLSEGLRQGTLPPHLRCLPTIGPMSMCAEIGAEGLPNLVGLPCSEPGADDPADPADPEALFHRRVRHWRARTWSAFILATAHVFVTMETQPDLCVADAVAFVDERAPDPATDRLLALFLDTARAYPVAGGLLFAPYMWSAQVLGRAQLNGTAGQVTQAALHGAPDAPALEALAHGRLGRRPPVGFRSPPGDRTPTDEPQRPAPTP